MALRSFASDTPPTTRAPPLPYRHLVDHLLRSQGRVTRDDVLTALSRRCTVCRTVNADAAGAQPTSSTTLISVR
jgi:hypothetical protein